MKLCIVPILLMISFLTQAQEPLLKGAVQDTSLRPLHGAHVQNLSTNKLAITAPNGTFAIPAKTGDSIRISYVGFEDYDIYVAETPGNGNLAVTLQSKEMILEDVVITPFPEYWDFKQMILDLDPPDSVLQIPIPKVGRYAYYDARTAPLDESGSAPTVGIPFDLEGLTKRGREKKQLQKKLTLEKKWVAASQKFNRDWVSRLTNLKGEELTDFIAFCDFPVDFINETHLIDLKNEILALLEEYREQTDDHQPLNYFPGS